MPIILHKMWTPLSAYLDTIRRVTRLWDAWPGDRLSIPVRSKMFISSGKRPDRPE